MNLHELRSLVADSAPDEWHQISDGPFFHNNPYHGDDSYYSQHYSRVVLASDLDVAIEWGLPTRSAENEPGHLWARDSHFPDPAVHSFWIDMFYKGSIVDRVRAYSVDGGRGYLPRYDQRRTDGGNIDDSSGATWEFTVDQWSYALTKLISRLSGLSEFNRYFDQAGFARP